MPEIEETYKGKKIIIDSDESRGSLSIDGTKVEVRRDGPLFYVSTMPYFTTKSLMELAKALIDRQV